MMRKQSYLLVVTATIALGLASNSSHAEDGWRDYVIKAPASVIQPQMIINNFLADVVTVTSQPGETVEGIANNPAAAGISGLIPLRHGFALRGLSLPGDAVEGIANNPASAGISGLTPLRNGMALRGLALPGETVEGIANNPAAAGINGLVPIRDGVVPRGQNFPGISSDIESNFIKVEADVGSNSSPIKPGMDIRGSVLTNRLDETFVDYTVRVPSEMTQLQAQRIIDNFVARFSFGSEAASGEQSGVDGEKGNILMKAGALPKGVVFPARGR